MIQWSLAWSHLPQEKFDDPHYEETCGTCSGSTKITILGKYCRNKSSTCGRSMSVSAKSSFVLLGTVGTFAVTHAATPENVQRFPGVQCKSENSLLMSAYRESALRHAAVHNGVAAHSTEDQVLFKFPVLLKNMHYIVTTVVKPNVIGKIPGGV